MLQARRIHLSEQWGSLYQQALRDSRQRQVHLMPLFDEKSPVQKGVLSLLFIKLKKSVKPNAHGLLFSSQSLS